jgi:hypothetical protein
LKTSYSPALTKISYVSQEMERQVAEITPETSETICHWMESALLRLGVPPTYVTYRAEYVPTVTGRMVLCTVAVLPHPSLPGFKGEVCYSTVLTVATARLSSGTGLPSRSVPCLLQVWDAPTSTLGLPNSETSADCNPYGRNLREQTRNLRTRKQQGQTAASLSP